MISGLGMSCVMSVFSYCCANFHFSSGVTNLKWSLHEYWALCCQIYFFKICGFMAVTMKNAVFWVVTPCYSCKNECFGGAYHLHHQGEKNQQAGHISSN
jgi:hypothetical protein